MLNWLADQTVTVLKLGCIISQRQIRSAQKNARRLITPFPRRKPRDLRRRKLLAIAEGIMDTTILRTYSLIAGAAMILIVALPLILIIQAALSFAKTSSAFSFNNLGKDELPSLLAGAEKDGVKILSLILSPSRYEKIDSRIIGPEPI
jgi:hypothetical protein